MQLPGAPGVDIVSVYAQLAEDGATFLAVVALLYAAGRLLVVPGVRWGLERSKFNRTVQSALVSGVHLLAVVGSVIVGASTAGFRGSLAGTTLVAAGITVAVGLAAQDVLGNFVSGAFIVSDPDLNVGDTIEWNGNRGTVVDIDLRVTRVRTLDNERIIVPNSELATTAVTNETVTDPVGISYTFGVDYSVDLDEVQGIIRNVARDLDHVAERPRPTVAVEELTASSVLIIARIWLPVERKNRVPAVRAAFIRNAHEACRAAGIDLSEDSGTELSGEVTVHEAAPDEDPSG
ncbi:mechanosensitive ion channel family protein [Haloarcula laminariae]|uniref:mechanosensitive ion channel family protein n=1 Tax=Haloarcula laminariae TaxID=2961577 RepID=UPI0021C70A22|nr:MULTISPECIES: mechanosensitive ion channel family protein [Halomicroarcula]